MTAQEGETQIGGFRSTSSIATTRKGRGTSSLFPTGVRGQTGHTVGITRRVAFVYVVNLLQEKLTHVGALHRSVRRPMGGAI